MHTAEQLLPSCLECLDTPYLFGIGFGSLRRLAPCPVERVVDSDISPTLHKLLARTEDINKGMVRKANHIVKIDWRDRAARARMLWMGHCELLDTIRELCHGCIPSTCTRLG